MTLNYDLWSLTSDLISTSLFPAALKVKIWRHSRKGFV